MSHELIARLNSEPIVYKEERCITLDLIDQLHERPEGTARAAFNRHKDRFTDGEDYHLVPYPQLQKGDIERTSDVRSSAGRGGYRGDVYLITETGYCMLVKPFKDDLAWRVQRELVKGYFSNREAGHRLPESLGRDIACAVVDALRVELVPMFREVTAMARGTAELVRALAESRHHHPEPLGGMAVSLPHRVVIRERIAALWPEATERDKNAVVRRMKSVARQKKFTINANVERGPLTVDACRIPFVDLEIMRRKQEIAARREAAANSRTLYDALAN